MKPISEKTNEYDNPWTLDGVAFTSEQIGMFVGFVYLITNMMTDERYIGRKYFSSLRKKKKDTRRTRSESDWKNYYGSSETIKEQIKIHGKNIFKRQIMSLHLTRGDINYYEIREQFVRDVLEEDGYINDNINGKWFRKAEYIKAGRKVSDLSSCRKSLAGTSGRSSE